MGSYRWILFRHGQKWMNINPGEVELTQRGRMQVNSTTVQLRKEIGEKLLGARIISSPVNRAIESARVFSCVCKLNPDDITIYPTLEWGPDDGIVKDEPTIRLLESFSSEIVVAFGHDGLFEHIAQIKRPVPDGYTLGEGEAFIISSRGVKKISPKIGLSAMR